MKKSRVWAALFACGVFACGAFAAGSAAAQSYPQRPVRLIVPTPAAGPTDSAARVIAERLSAQWNQGVIVENKPGAGQAIGTEFVAKSAPDGHTVLVGTTPHVTNLTLRNNLPYDTLKDFAPVGMVATFPLVLVINPELPSKTVGEFIQLAKTKPMRGSSPGIAGSPHLALEMFNQIAGVKIQHIPYKGASDAILAVARGEVDAYFDSPVGAFPQARAGKVRALGVTSAERSPYAPDVPTVAESGLPGFNITAWVGLFVPSATPRETVQTLNAELRKVLAMPEVSGKLAGMMLRPAGGAPEELGEFVNREIARWRDVIRAAAIKLE